MFNKKSLENLTHRWKRGHIPWNKGIKKRTNTGRTHFKKGHKINLGKHWKQKNGRVKGDKNEYNKWYKKTHRELACFHVIQRRARKKGAEGSHTLGEWELLKKQYGYICPCCGRKEPKIKLTRDHIIPLDKGGSDYIENIQPLCKSCNSKKHTKIIKY